MVRTAALIIGAAIALSTGAQAAELPGYECIMLRPTGGYAVMQLYVGQSKIGACPTREFSVKCTFSDAKFQKVGTTWFGRPADSATLLRVDARGNFEVISQQGSGVAVETGKCRNKRLFASVVPAPNK